MQIVGGGREQEFVFISVLVKRLEDWEWWQRNGKT